MEHCVSVLFGCVFGSFYDYCFSVAFAVGDGVGCVGDCVLHRFVFPCVGLFPYAFILTHLLASRNYFALAVFVNVNVCSLHLNTRS